MKVSTSIKMLTFIFDCLIENHCLDLGTDTRS